MIFRETQGALLQAVVRGLRRSLTLAGRDLAGTAGRRTRPGRVEDPGPLRLGRCCPSKMGLRRKQLRPRPNNNLTHIPWKKQGMTKKSREAYFAPVVAVGTGSSVVVAPPPG